MAPTDAAVRGSERLHRIPQERDDDRAVGQYELFGAGAVCAVCRLRSPPGQSTIGGCTHEDARPLGVAIAVELAAGIIVARDPVLVVSAAAIHWNRVAPVDPVLRTAGSDIDSVVADGKTGNQ